MWQRSASANTRLSLPQIRRVTLRCGQPRTRVHHGWPGPVVVGKSCDIRLTPRHYFRGPKAPTWLQKCTTPRPA